MENNINIFSDFFNFVKFELRLDFIKLIFLNFGLLISSTVTLNFFFDKSFVKCDPINPLPPVTKIFFH